MRKSSIERNTAETKIRLSLELDAPEGGRGTKISTGCGFFDHMLTLFAKHGGFSLDVACIGDVEVDYHHSVEDIGICLGKAFAEALGGCRGITRYGSVILPMDEALILCAVDISGRGMSVYDVKVPTEKVGDFDTELAEEFMTAFARNAGITLHLKQLAGTNSHHIIEGAFKALARALRAAVEIDAENASSVPSTKGMLV